MIHIGDIAIYALPWVLAGLGLLLALGAWCAFQARRRMWRVPGILMGCLAPLLMAATYTGLPVALTNSTGPFALANYPSWQYFAVLRLGVNAPGDAPPQWFIPSATACAIPGGDIGSQVATPDGGCMNVAPSNGPYDLREWAGNVCGSADSHAALQAAVNFVSGNKGGAIAIPCPITIAATVTVPGAVRLTGNGPVYYPGMTDIPGPAVWPPAAGPAINCTSTTLACLDVTGEGVEIDHINFGNPQPAPPSSGSYTPTVFPYVISTDASSGWQGLNIHDVSCTACSKWIDLEGGANYSTAYTGSQIRLSHLWCNPCLNVGLRTHDIDNPFHLDFFETTPSWYFNNSPLGAYLRAHAIGWDVQYLAAPQFSNLDFFALAAGIQLSNGAVTNNFGTINMAISAAEGTNISFNQSCQAMTMPNGNGTIASLKLTNVSVWGDQSGFVCSAGKAMFSLPTNDVNIALDLVDIYDVDRFMDIGCGAPGTGGCPAGGPGGGAIARLDHLDAENYSHYTAGEAFLTAPSTASICLGATRAAGIVPASGGGKLMGPGLDGSQAFMCGISVGGGLNALEGSALVVGSGDTSHTGSVEFFTPDGVERGFVGGATAAGNLVLDSANGVNIVSTNGAHNATVSFGTGSTGQSLINVNGLPTACTGQPTGTLWDNAGIVQVCP